MPRPALDLNLLLVTLALPSFGGVRLRRIREHLLVQSELRLRPPITVPAAPDLQVRRGTSPDGDVQRLGWCGSAAEAALI